MTVHAIRDLSDFEASVMEAGLPVLVAFSAEWCAPCAWLDPYLTEISERENGRVLTCKVDVDRIPELAHRYRIASVPTVILIRSGTEVERSLGVEPARLRRMAEGGLPTGHDPDPRKAGP